MADLFNPTKNFPAPKIEPSAVPWAGMIFQECQKHGYCPEIEKHILGMADGKGFEYAKYLFSLCGFPREFFARFGINLK